MKKLQVLILLLVSSLVSAKEPKILLFTQSYNRPDLIKVQWKTLKHFLQGDYEFVVCNDAPTDDMCKQIEQACKECGIRCIRIPQEIHTRPYLHRTSEENLHNPNVRHSNIIQYTFDTIGFDHDGIVGIIDSDMFLVRPLNIAQEMEGYDVIAVPRYNQNNIKHFCTAMMFLDMRKLPNKRTMNFNCGRVEGVYTDSGGNTHVYLKNNPSVRVKDLTEILGHELFCIHRFIPERYHRKAGSRAQEVACLRAWGFNEKEINFLQKKPDTIEFYFNHKFLHYRAGTKYDGQPEWYHEHKEKMVYEFLDDVMGK